MQTFIFLCVAITIKASQRQGTHGSTGGWPGHLWHGGRASSINKRGTENCLIYRTEAVLYILQLTNKYSKIIRRKGAGIMREEVQKMFEMLSEEDKARIIALASALLRDQTETHKGAAAAQA